MMQVQCSGKGLLRTLMPPCYPRGFGARMLASEVPRNRSNERDRPGFFCHKLRSELLCEHGCGATMTKSGLVRVDWGLIV